MQRLSFWQRSAIAIAIYLLSLALYVWQGENGWVRLLWLAGMIWWPLSLAWPGKRPRFDRQDGRDFLLLALITGVGWALRAWRLSLLPAFFHGDIASQGLQALAILQGRATNWFGAGWSHIPMFDFVMMAGTMRLWGRDLFGLSMTALWQGVLTLPLLYLLGREIGGRRVGLLAAAFLAINPAHIHFSRLVTTASPLLFMVATYYVLFRSRRLHSLGGFALAGVLLGLSLMLYFPVRITVIVALLLFGWLALWQRRALLAAWQGWLSFALGALLGFGPMMGFVFQDFTAFVGRGNVVTLANPAVVDHLMAKYRVDSMAALWLEQCKRTFGTFFTVGDASTHFAFPHALVSLPVAILMVGGLLLALRSWRNERMWTLVVWWLGTLMLGGVLTNDPPFWPHLIIVLPAVALLAALAAVWLWDQIVARWPLLQPWMTAVLVLMVILLGWHNWRTYVAWVEHTSDTRVHIARLIGDLPADTVVWLLEDPVFARDRELQFMGQHLRLVGIKADGVPALLQTMPQTPIVAIFTPNHDDVLPLLQNQLPGGDLRAHEDVHGRLMFRSYHWQPAAFTRDSHVADPASSRQRRQAANWVLGLLLWGLSAAAGLHLWRSGPEADGHPTAAHPSSTGPITTPTRPQAATASNQPSRPRFLLEISEHPWRAFLLLAVAIPLAYAAQAFYDARLAGGLAAALMHLLPPAIAADNVLAGSLLNLLAMLLFAIAAPPLSALVSVQPRPRRPFQGRWRPDARIHRPGPRPSTRASAEPPSIPRVWLVPVLALYALLMLLFALRGEDGLVRGLWLLALALFVGTQALWPWWRQRHTVPAEPSPAWQWPHVLLLALVLAAGFWLRFTHLAVLPHDFHGDMASHGLQAREILAGQATEWFRAGWANIPMLAFMPAALSMKLFGNTIFGLRMASVIEGSIVLLGLYLLTWRLFDRHRPALLATAILAVNTPHIHFSRIAEYMDPWPFLVLAMFLLVDGLKGRRAASFAAAGVLLGLGLQMYYSSRVIVFILLLALLYIIVFRRQWLRDNGWGILLLLVGGLLALGPSLIYFARHSEAFLERSRAVFLYYEPVMTHLKGKYGLDSSWAVLGEQIKRSLLMFQHSIDSSTQFGYPHPMFGPLLGPWVALGTGYALRHWRRPGPGLTLIWLGLIMVLGSIFTNNAPFWPRLVGILPAAALLAGLALDRTLVVLQSLMPAPSQRQAWLLALLALAGIAWAGRENWQLYEQTVRFNARGQARVGRYIETLPQDMAVCNFRDPFALQVRETYFLAWPRPLQDMPPDAPDGLLARCPGPPLVWILTPNHMDRLPALQARWPNGVLEQHYYGNGVLAFNSYMVAEQPLTEAQPLPAPISPTHTPPAPEALTGNAFMPDGSDFQPQQIFVGDTSSSPWQIDAGQITVSGGRIELWVGPLAGHDAVFDYVSLRAATGEEYRFEAEDPAITSGDSFAAREGVDNHWWLQDYAPFSHGQGLVAHKQELVPALHSVLRVPDGVYQVTIGSFTGDPNNGVFALGISWQ